MPDLGISVPGACSDLEPTLLTMYQTGSARELMPPRIRFQPMCITHLLNGLTLSCMFTRVRTNCKFRWSTFTQQHPRFWHQSCLGVPKATLSYNNSPEGLTEFTDAIILMVTIYNGEKKQIKISQVKRCIGQSPGGVQTYGFQLSSLSGIRKC